MERVYWNDEWNQPKDNGHKDSYRMEIWDFKSEGIEVYSLEEYYKLELHKNKYKHVNKHSK